MKDFIAESERRFDERFKEAIENIEWNWNEGDFVIDDIKAFLTTELLAAYEKGRKDFGEKMVGEVEGMKREYGILYSDVSPVDQEFAGAMFNRALSAVASLLREGGGKLSDAK